MSITHFNGFDKGVIGNPLPADTTLNNMRKADLIELLHIAESNHDVLAQAYRIAVDNSKCHRCPLGRDREKIRADAINEIESMLTDKDIAQTYDFDEVLCKGNYDANFNDFRNYVREIAEQVKEKKNN